MEEVAEAEGVPVALEPVLLLAEGVDVVVALFEPFAEPVELVAEAAAVGEVLLDAELVSVAAGAAAVAAAEGVPVLLIEVLAALGLAATAGVLVLALVVAAPVPLAAPVGVPVLLAPVAGMLAGELVQAASASAAMTNNIDSKVNFFIYSNPPTFLLYPFWTVP